MSSFNVSWNLILYQIKKINIKFGQFLIFLKSAYAPYGMDFSTEMCDPQTLTDLKNFWQSFSLYIVSQYPGGRAGSEHVGGIRITLTHIP